MRSPRSVLAALTVAAVLPLAGCGEVDEQLAGRLEALDITLYLPELRDSEPQRTSYDDELRAASTDFEGISDPVVGDGGWRLDQQRAPEGAEPGELCRALGWQDADYGCDDNGDWAVTDYEGSTTVGVVRGGTLLVAHVETEDDDALTEQTATALLEAPEVDVEELARQ